jgi:uncharacterized protein (TIGR03435 family)
MKTLAILITCTGLALAQPAFDVISIKPNTEGGRMTMAPLNGGKYTARNIDVRTLIRAAYRVQDFQIAGAGLDSQRYDIDAKSETAAGAADTRLMLQALLADKFHLKLRHDTKEVSAYKLVVISGKPPKMTKGDATGCDPEPSPSDPCDQIRDTGKFTLVGTRVYMKNFVVALGSLLSDTVVDQTGLDGVYDFTLDLGRAGFTPAAGSPGNQMDGVNAVIAGLQDQLGLKLERTKTPVELLVIEHVEKPAAN